MPGLHVAVVVNGDTGVVASIRACAEPMQACAPL
jgi:hypothetical protein